MRLITCIILVHFFTLCLLPLASFVAVQAGGCETVCNVPEDENEAGDFPCCPATGCNAGNCCFLNFVAIEHDGLRAEFPAGSELPLSPGDMEDIHDGYRTPCFQPPEMV